MMTQENYNYNHFSYHNFYTSLNTYLVDIAELRPGQKVVDLACGPGAVTKLILEKLRGARDSLIIGVDTSASALKLAADNLASVKSHMVEFVQGSAERLSDVVKEKVDAVILCNAIHLMEDKPRLIEEVSKSLNPGGVFAFNSAFFQGAQPPDTERFYRRWIMGAMRNLKKEYGITPQRGDRVEARKPLSLGQYCFLLEQNGFQVAQQEVRPIQMDREAFKDISRFSDFVEGTFPGVAVDKASLSMQEAVSQAFSDLGLESVTRNWLNVVARRL